MAGLTVVKVAPFTESTNLLSMNSLVNFTSGRDMVTVDVVLSERTADVGGGGGSSWDHNGGWSRVQLCLLFSTPMTTWLSGRMLFGKIYFATCCCPRMTLPSIFRLTKHIYIVGLLHCCLQAMQFLNFAATPRQFIYKLNQLCTWISLYTLKGYITARHPKLNVPTKWV